MQQKKIQSILEYCIFLGLIAAVFAAMQLYAKRGLQSSLKVAGDAMGFHSDNSMGLDEEQQKYFKQRDPKTFGKNRIKSASRAEYNAGEFSSVDVSASESAFTGANIGHVMTPNLEDMRHTPNIVGALAKNDMSDIEIWVSDVKKHCYYKKSRNRSFAERCGGACPHDKCWYESTNFWCPGKKTAPCCAGSNGSGLGKSWHYWTNPNFNPATVYEWTIGNCSGAPSDNGGKKCSTQYASSHSGIEALSSESCPSSF